MAEIKGSYTAGQATITWDAATQSAPNVGFRLGTQAGLENLAKASVQAGVFYLTTDTHRLYIGNSDGTISPVNQGVITVASLSSVTSPIPGQFYYISGSNILATYNGSAWVQINPDTYVDGVTDNVAAVTGGVQLSTTVSQAGNKSGQVASTTPITVKGGNKIRVANSGNTVTVDTGDYGIETSGSENAVNVDLTYKGPADTSASTLDSIKLKSTGDIKITQANGEITIDGTTLKNNISGTDVSSAEFVDGNNNATSNKGFTLFINKEKGTNVYAEVDPEITVGVAAGKKKTVSFESGVAALSVYTAEEVDGLILKTKNECNALVYRGTVGTTGATVTDLPQNNVQVGDVYMSDGSAKVKLTAAGNAIANPHEAGSLYIATGTEDATTGKIANGGVTWTVVDNFTSNTVLELGLGEANKISFTNKTGSVEDYLGSFKVVGAGDTNSADIITTTETKSGTGSKDKTITVKHATSGYQSTTAVSLPDASSTDVLFTTAALGTVTVDKYGHVKAAAEKAITVPTEKFSEDSTTSTVTVTKSGDNYSATLSDSVTLTVGNKEIDTLTMNHKVASSSLEIKTNTAQNEMSVNLIWGTF